MMADNSGDERFPVILENIPAADQVDLCTMKLIIFDKKSPKYSDLDLAIKLGFSGICLYYKPKTMANLL